ncbi:MAG: M20/M25/M40 family metallo-hydrolase [Melioribacteraceae bacterium]|nr:M20/M25/M40 family metallo-hydrolase [Melioribacteraceae bacterium]MDD3558966.1 M20/M25/M40 family metallo-hydrolase [Melioribacteraceae bacterium]
MRFRYSFFIFFVLSFVIVAQAQESEEITVDELTAHIKYLASDELEGRKPGTLGGKLAAEYIRNELKKNSIKLLGEDGFQNFDVLKGIEVGEGTKFLIGEKELEFSKDYSLFPISSEGDAISSTVFCGYGFSIDEENLNWNDYKDIDVTGKWVIVLRGAPIDSTGRFENYSALRKKALTAKDNGAAGIIFVSGLQFDPDDELVELDNSRESNVGIPVLQLKRNVLDEIFTEFEISVEQMEAFYAENLAPYSIALDIPFDISVKIKKLTDKTQNIIAIVEGSDPILKDEYIIIGAHYDHLGMGGPGSGSRRPDTIDVHNGADDNASGSAAILEIIEKIQANASEFKRSIIFVAFAAEEMGLLGSKYFTENPPVPLEKIKFMINLDMVGRLNEEDKSISIGGTGTAVGLPELINDVLNSYEMKATLSPEGFGPSDHASFYAKDIPVMFLFTGIHDDYHTPEDDWDKLNFEGEKLVSDFAYSIIERISNLDLSLVYQEAGPKERSSETRKFKVTLGIMPDVAASDSRGLRVDGVIKDRPAFYAGMKKGDVIISMDGKEVGDIYDYMNRLSSFKQGQRITVEVLRGEEKVILIVEL